MFEAARVYGAVRRRVVQRLTDSSCRTIYKTLAANTSAKNCFHCPISPPVRVAAALLAADAFTGFCAHSYACAVHSYHCGVGRALGLLSQICSLPPRFFASSDVLQRVYFIHATFTTALLAKVGMLAFMSFYWRALSDSGVVSRPQLFVLVGTVFAHRVLL